jgi:glucose-6-phosphate 1-dehydrogenase
MNEIVIDFANPGSITIEFLAKVPGPELTLGQSTMVFSHSESFARANALEGYERLILLAMNGDQALFTRSDGIERLGGLRAAAGEPPAGRAVPPRRLMGTGIGHQADRP